MAEVNQTIMEKAEARFLNAQKKTAERGKAMTEYQLEAKAREAKTAKLRELRLAKEAADRAAQALAPAPAPKKRAAKAKTQSSAE